MCSRHGLGAIIDVLSNTEPLPLHKGFAEETFEEVGDVQTEVIFLYSFKLRFPFNLMTRFIKHHLQADVKKKTAGFKSQY